MFWPNLIRQNWNQNLYHRIFWDQFKRWGFGSLITLCLLLTKGWLPNLSAACQCPLGLLVSTSEPLQSPASIETSTQTSGKCLVWASLWAPRRPFLWQEPLCTTEICRLVQGGFAFVLLLADYLSTCPGVSQFSLPHLSFQQLPHAISSVDVICPAN